MWAIRHKPSGKLLPRPKTGKGGSYVEVNDKFPPRLFSTKSAASNALRWWLAGQAYWEHEWSQGSDEFFATHERTELKSIPVAGRVAEDMEIVEVELVIK